MGVGPIAGAAIGGIIATVWCSRSQLTYPPLSFFERQGQTLTASGRFDRGHEAARDHRIRAFIQIPVRPT